ncbi:pentatricopeptide repeat-containing protein At5g48910-like [Typha angustifolia]|uniref:pentatricopeptide repeat-containing protein At5g48910-like n=1 Tax=Typha angustifolia TaxID=59011 RepID=UPI003C2E966A
MSAAPFPLHQLSSSHPQDYGKLPKKQTQINLPFSSSPTKSHPKPHQTHPPPASQDPILRFSLLLSRGALAPNRIAFPSLFRSCHELHALEEGRQLHAHAVKSGFLYDVPVQRSLIRMYTKCHACQDALNVLAMCSKPDDVISQNDLIVGFCRIGDLRSAQKVFDGMAERNVVSWSVMIDGYARSGEMEIAQDLFDAMPERNEFSWNSLISGYLRCGRVEVARRIFDSMVSEWGVVTWTTMISGYVQNCQFREALEVFIDMQMAGVKPNKVTLVSVLPAVAELGALTQGQWIHAYIGRMGVQVDSILGSALLDMYSKCGCIDDAINIFQNLKHKELSAWNSIILGLAAHGRGRDALNFFSRMQDDPLIIPNDITFIGLLSACSHAGLVSEGQAVFNLFTSHYRLTPNIRHYACMVDILGRAGLLEEALEFLEKMPIQPNPVIWKTLLSACRIHKNVEMVNRVWRKVVELGPKDSGFYILIANIYNDVGQLDDTARMRKEMNDLQVRKVAGCSWVEVDGVVHEFFMGRESFHAQSRDIICVLHEMEKMLKVEEEYNL